MNNIIMLFIFIPVLSAALLALNLLLSPSRPDREKLLSYECGFDPIQGQTRNNFHISFFLITLAFLILDLEILLFFPISVSLFQIGTFGLVIGLIFFIILTLGYVIEILAGNLTVSNSNLTKTN